MEKVRLTKLSEPVRSFLARVKNGKGLLVEDERGRVVATVLPEERAAAAYVDATPAEREEAWKRLRKLQRKTGKAVKEQGITEEDIIREVLKDD